MKTILPFILLILCIRPESKAQNLHTDWAFTIDNFDYTAWVTKVVTADDGSVYNIGSFQDTVDFDPGPAVFEMRSGASTNYIAKYDASGNFIWAKKFIGDPFILESKLDKQGNIYLSGSVQYLILDSSFTNTPVTIVSAGISDAIIIKMNSLGELVWVKTFGNNDYGDAQTFCVDVDMNVYLFGNFGGLTDFDPGPGIFNLNSQTTFCDFYFLKLDASGNFIWAKTIGGSHVDAVYNCDIDNANNIYLTGRFSDSVDFDPGNGIYKIFGGAYDTVFNYWPESIYLLKIDSAANFQWVTQINQSNSAFPKIAADAFGNVYLADQFSDQVKFTTGAAPVELTTNGDNDAYIAQWDASGNFGWAKPLAGSGDCNIKAITADDAGYIYVGGYFKDTLRYNPNNMSEQFISNNKSSDIFYMKMNMLGNNTWVKTVGNKKGQEITSIAVNDNDDIYLAGSFSDTLDVDPNNTIFNLNSPANKITGFLQKLQQTPTGLETFLNSNTTPVIYPNPNNGCFTIELNKNALLTVTNIYGQVIFIGNYSAGKYKIDLSTQSDGLYMVHLNGKTVNFTEKMIKASY